MYALYLELHFAMLVGIILECITYIEGLLRLYIFRLSALTECNTIEDGIRLVIDKLKLDVLLTAANHLACSVITHVVCAEYRFGIVWAMRRKLLHIVEEATCYLMEIKFRVNLNHGVSLFGEDILRYILLETLSKSLDVFDLQREARRIGVTTKILEQIATALHGLVYIKAHYRARRASCHIASACYHNRRAVIDLGKTRCYNTNDATVPIGIEDDYGTLLIKALEPFDNGICLFGHALVELLTRLVELVYLAAHLECGTQVVLNEKVYSDLALLYATRCINARTNLEYNIVYAYLLFGKTANLNDGLKANAWAVVNLLDSMESEDTVFAHYRNKVRRNANSH